MLIVCQSPTHKRHASQRFLLVLLALAAWRIVHPENLKCLDPRNLSLSNHLSDGLCFFILHGQDVGKNHIQTAGMVTSMLFWFVTYIHVIMRMDMHSGK